MYRLIQAECPIVWHAHAQSFYGLSSLECCGSAYHGSAPLTMQRRTCGDGLLGVRFDATLTAGWPILCSSETGDRIAILHRFNPMLTVINSRAKLPTDLAAISRDHKITYRDLLSVNPKTEKSKVQTYILHLAPASLSGFNVCPGAGNCKKVCLHFAGNPVYMKGKQSARIRRTLAYVADPQRFARLIVCAILSKLAKNSEPIAIRLNGTSDIAWENLDFAISPEFAQFCRVKFGAILPIGKRNIFEIFNFMRDNTGENVTFYDYTKIRRNWAECKRLGYHLTFSFDGWNNRANVKLCRMALRHGVNVAAAFNIRRRDVLPLYVSASHFDTAWHGRSLAVHDGDLTDYRPAEGYNGAIIGLRFKLPHGAQWSDVQRESFCMF